MGLFTDQIKQRQKNDQAEFEDTFVHLAGAVLGSRDAGLLNDDRMITSGAIEEILKYYHFKATQIPPHIKDADEQLEFLMRPHGIMRRSVKLTGKWYKDAFGPMLVFKKDSSMAVALIPKGLVGYYYKDFDSGKKITVNEKNFSEFETDAVCFYKPFPLKELGISDLFAYIKGCINYGDIALVTVAAITVTLIGMIIPTLTKILTGPVLKSGNTSILVSMGVFMLCSAISALLIEMSKNMIFNRISIKTGACVYAAAMMRILTLPTGFFRKFSSGELTSRVECFERLCDVMFNVVMLAVITAAASLLYVVQIASFAPSLAKPAVGILLIITVISALSIFIQSKISTQQMTLSAKTSGMTYSLITGVQKIKLAGAEKRMFSRWAKEYAKSAERKYNLPLFAKIYPVLIIAVLLIGNIVLYYSAVKSNIALNEYMAFNSAYGIISGAFTVFSGIACNIAIIPSLLNMAKPILNAKPEVADNKKVISRLSGGIELNNISFRYNENQPYIIDDLSLKIRPGEYVAIVGRTGCGKSTLMRLMLGFETPQCGAVFYDGRDLCDIDKRSLRRRIGTVMQDGQLFSGDIFSNITISSPCLTIDDAWEAAEIAGIADDIRDMPLGMHTTIGEGQGGISGGQKQRLMIARAIAPKPKILMFDEATSALDNKAQKQVLDALNRIECTRIVIAHRLSTIKNCDRILFLENGKIIEDGTYDELMSMGGEFAALVERQRM